MAAKRKKTEIADKDLESVLEHIRPEFIEEGARGIGADDVAAVVGQLDEVARRFEGGGTLAHLTEDAGHMISALRDFQSGRYTGLSFWTVSLITFVFQYVLKPIDIIPDSLPGIGQLDDAVVISLCLTMVRRDLGTYKIWRLAQEIGDD